MLKEIEKQLNENSSCILMHLILISKTLRDCTLNDMYKSVDKTFVENLRKLTAKTIMSQISHVIEYLDIVVIIQLYNVLR